jgi:hypothetical protein
MNVRESYPPGATVRIPRTELSKLDSIPKTIQLISPDGSGKSVTVPETGDFALPAMDRVGVYATDPAIPGYEHMAVNLLDPNESNLMPADAPPGGTGETVTMGTGKSRMELWWYVVAAAVGMLMIEWWVYTRRVHM